MFIAYITVFLFLILISGYFVFFSSDKELKGFASFQPVELACISIVHNSGGMTGYLISILVPLIMIISVLFMDRRFFIKRDKKRYYVIIILVLVIFLNQLALLLSGIIKLDEIIY